MEELLEALKADDEERVSILACKLFLTKEGRSINERIREFEKFANCRIFAAEKASDGVALGWIKYAGENPRNIEKFFYYGKDSQEKHII